MHEIKHMTANFGKISKTKPKVKQESQAFVHFWAPETMNLISLAN
jgi:hypothetical protein